MERVLGNLKPERVFYYFEELSKIPRGSDNEKEVSDYLYKTFKDKGYDVTQDDSWNIIIKKQASMGYENAPVVMLQGHIDMVCEKNEGVDHDFLKDPLKLRIVDGNIMATGTTLGADNGIGVALALALLEDETLEHPAFEVVLTSNEEMGMVGATKLDCSGLKSKILLNLDNGGEGVFTVSCAGGGNVALTMPYSTVAQTKKAGFRIGVKGLAGGHSGADINKGLGNSLKLLARMLYDLKDSIEISEVYGGSKSNAIPREAFAVISSDSKDELAKKVEKWSNVFKTELAAHDSDVTVVFEDCDLKDKVFDKTSKEKLIYIMNLIPNGVATLDVDANFVVSSSNFGVLETASDKIIFTTSLRSSVEVEMYDNLVPKMRLLAEMFDLGIEETDFYPGWPLDKNSFITDLCLTTYEKLNGRKGRASAIHAGLECGYFIKKFGGKLDAVSLGPVMKGAHTPEESLDIASVERLYDFLKEVIRNIK